MALVYADRVYETTTTTGTGTVSLAGASSGGYQTFVAGVGTGNTCYYCIVDSATDDWEVGLGTVTSGTPDTLSRDTVYDSSNAGSLVTFAAGTKDVFLVEPALVAGQDGGITEVVQDTTPQLGGDLDLNGHSITGELLLGGISDKGAYNLQVTGDAFIEDQLRISGAAATNRTFVLATAGGARWIQGADNTAEAGSNAGSNWYLSSYDDTNAYLERVLTIERSTGRLFHGQFVGSGFDAQPYKMEIAHHAGEGGLIINAWDSDTAELTLSGKRTGNGNSVAQINLANRDSSSTSNTAVASISAERQSVDGLDLVFSAVNGGSAFEGLRIKYNNQLFVSTTTNYLGFYPGSTAAVMKVGYGRSGDASTYFDLISDTTNQFTYSARLIRWNGVNGPLELINRGTGTLQLKNENLAPIRFAINGSVIGEFSTSGNLETTGQILADQNVAAGVGTSGGADCSAGYNRAADGVAAYSMYADSAAATTESAWLLRDGGTNGLLTLANRGTGGIKLNTFGGVGSIEFHQNSVSVGEFDTSGNLNITGQFNCDGNILAGLGATGAANCSAGYGRTVDGTTGYVMYADSANSTTPSAYVTRLGGTNQNLQIVNTGTGVTQFINGGSERGRFTDGGYFMVGTTSASISAGNSTTTGTNLVPGGAVVVARSGAAPLVANRITSDGMVLDVYQDGTWEGGLSVSGTTVSVTGGHLSRLSQGPDTGIQRGTVMSNIPEMCVWEGEENEQLTKTKVSDVKGDKAVAGVFDMVDDRDELGDYIIAQSGDFIVLVTGPVQSGDLLMSNGDGTATKQPDDVVRASTVAKAMFDIEDASVQLIPCILMIG